MPRIHPMCDAMATASHRFLTSFPTEFAKAVAAIHHLKPKATPSAAVGAPEPVAGDDDKLLPCLSCGCEQVELITSYSYGSEMFHVRCGNCMMRTERSCGKSKVVETWNSRDGSTVPRAEYDRVVKLMNHFRDVIAEYHDMATADSKPTNVHNPESEDTPSHNPVLGPVVGAATVTFHDQSKTIPPEVGKRYVCRNGIITPPMKSNILFGRKQPYFFCEIDGMTTYWGNSGRCKAGSRGDLIAEYHDLRMRQSWLREAREQLLKLDVANAEVLLPPTVAVGSNANAGLVPARVRNQAMIVPSLSGVSAAEAEVDARCKAIAERLRTRQALLWLAKAIQLDNEEFGQ